MGWNLAAGVLLGLLVGALLGLSATPVVGSVLGAIIAGAMVFLSLSTIGSATQVDPIQLARISAFSAFAIIGAILGIAARANSWLGDAPIRQQYEDLLAVGIPESQAREAILSRFNTTSAETESEKARTPVLFAATAEQCAQLGPDRFDSEQSILAAYVSAGEPWSNAAEIIEKMPKEQRASLFLFVYRAVCPNST